MMRLRPIVLLSLAGLALVASQGGCAYVEPETDPSKIGADPTEAKGPGLLTGKSGAWTIYRK